jgi:hypothetical protein
VPAASNRGAPPPPPPKHAPEQRATTILLRALPRATPPRGHEDHLFVRRPWYLGGGWALAERRVSADALPLPPPTASPRAGKARVAAVAAAASGWTAHQAAGKVRVAIAAAADRAAGEGVGRAGAAVGRPLKAVGRAVLGVLPHGARRQVKAAGM